MKKNRKKKNQHNRNVFGEPCISKVIKFEKETAIQQFLKIQEDLESSKNLIEYTVDLSCFDKSEIEAFTSQITKIMELRSHFNGKGFINPSKISLTA